MKMRLVCPLLTLLCLLASPLRSAAQDVDGGSGDSGVTNEQRAVEMFQISEKLYSDGRYEQALQYLQQAHALHASPTLLYNMARANEKLDRLQEAVDMYTSYLGTVTDQDDREQTERRIRTLQTEIDERNALRNRRQVVVPVGPRQTQPDQGESAWSKGWNPDDPLAKDEPEPESGPSSPLVPWILAGGGAALFGTGLVMYLVATGKHDEAVDAESQEKAFEQQASGEDIMLVGNILVGIGGAVAVTGGVLLTLHFIDQGEEPDIASNDGLRPVVGPTYLGLTGTF